MTDTRRVTARLPAKLLDRAQRATGEGTAETRRRALEIVVTAKAADDLRALRGKLRLSVHAAEFRRDRR